MKLRVKGFGLLLLLVLLALCSTIDVCDARRGKHWRPRSSPSSSLLKRKGKGKKGSSHRQYGSNRPSPKPLVSPPPSPEPPVSPPPSPGVGKGYQSPYQTSPSPSPNAPVSPSPSPANGNGHSSPKPPTPSCGKGNQPPSRLPPAAPQGAVFNVVDFGAKGDGVTDDTKAFEAAWAAACKQGASTVLVPSELEFLVGPISFSGPYCKPNILFQGGLGLVQDVRFSNIQVSEVQTPIIIDQFYCDRRTLFRDHSYWSSTQTRANTPLPPKRPILLACFWRTLHSNHPSHSLLADWKTCWKQLTVIPRHMLKHRKYLRPLIGAYP